MSIRIAEGELVQAIGVLRKLPEFYPLLNTGYYLEKLKGKKSLVLIGFDDRQPVACKVGYQKFNDGSFYSWLGGVLPDYRKRGIAKRLADEQEQWARNAGYQSIKFKTLNRHKNMLQFALKNGFNIYNVKPNDELENYRVEMIKDLL